MHQLRLALPLSIPQDFATENGDVWRYCAWCGEAFYHRRYWQKFCCSACRKQANYMLNRDYRIEHQRHYRAEKREKRNSSDETHLTQALLSEISDLKALVQQLLARPVAPSQTVTRSITISETVPLDDPTIEISASKSDEKPAYNFMISNAKSGLMSVENLPLEVKEYGVAKGILPASLLPKPVQGGIKKMNIPTIETPSFDDNEDEDIDLFS